ncbi:MAG: aminotransferase class I/II-fold pyridoxal phosphate-dependent enzyme, partial [Bacteroidales bacterium]|nr:aminotransferase class I/II-fold pyridoxal phosphate-dependent enzyme [Bacteroidales bacterium]
IHNELTAPDRLYTPFARVVADDEALAKSLKYVVCASPSKSFNTAGLQNAFLVVADADLRRRVDRAINLNEVCDVNPFGIEATIAAYTEGGEWLDELRRYLWQNYAFARKTLADALPDIAIADLQATYLMWVDCRAVCERMGLDDKALANLLIEKGRVWLCAGSDYGKAGAGFLRINLACPRATLSEALLRVEQTLSPALPLNGEGALDTIGR